MVKLSLEIYVIDVYRCISSEYRIFHPRKVELRAIDV